MTHRTVHAATALASTGLLCAVLTACGGGGGDAPYPDPNGTSQAQHLSCTSACIESDTQSSSALYVEYFVLDDGQRAQAQAGFSTHPIILNYNVELNGDVQNVMVGGTTKALELPVSANQPWDFELQTPPYLADIPSAKSGSTDFSFQLVRSGGTLTSSVTLPPPFTLSAPAGSLGEQSVPLTLSGVAGTPSLQVYTYTCTGMNGFTKTQSGSAQAAGPLFTRVDDGDWLFNVPNFVATANAALSAASPSATTARSCSVKIDARVTNNGTLAPGFGSTSTITAYQTRQITLALN